MIIEEGTPVIHHGPTRPKWIVAVVAAVTMLAVAMGGVAGAFLVNGRGTGAGLDGAASYVSADAFMYLEARLDLPGDQAVLFDQLLAHFPSEARQLLGDRLGEQFDEWLTDAAAPFDYSTDIAPWFNGRIAMAALDYPSSTDLATGAMPRVLVFAGVRDRAQADDLARRLRTTAEGQGTAFTTTQYRGVEIVASKPSADHEPAFGYALTNDQVIFATDPQQIHQALDVHADASPSLAASSQVRALSAALPADRVASMVVNYAPVLAAMKDQLETSGVGPELFDVLASLTPTYVVGAGRVEADRLRFDMVSPAPKGSGVAIANRDRGLAAAIPADAIFVAEGNDVGATLSRVVTSVKGAAGSVAAPEAKEQIAQVESVLGAKLEAFVDWIGDGALVAGYHDNQPYGGLVLTATDITAATQRLGQLTSLAKLAGGDANSGIKVDQQEIAGTEVTTLRMGSNGIDPMGFGGLSGGGVVQYAVTDDRVIIGFGDTFVGRVLELDQADSLAASDRYESAMQSVGGSTNAGATFLDLAALRSALEPLLAPMVPGSGQIYEKEILPWLEPLDYIVGASRVDGDRLVQRSAIVVK